MHGAGLDPKAVAFQHGAKRSAGGRLQRIEPDDQHAREAQEVRHPIERRLDRLIERCRPSRRTTSYCPAGRPQFDVLVVRAEPRRRSSITASSLLAPVTMILFLLSTIELCSAIT